MYCCSSLSGERPIASEADAVEERPEELGAVLGVGVPGAGVPGVDAFMFLGNLAGDGNGFL